MAPANEITSLLTSFGQELASIKQLLFEMLGSFQPQPVTKDWYTTGELAEAMNVSQFSVQARWCAGGRIECEKDNDTGRWRIPGHEYRRLLAGGGLRSAKKKNAVLASQRGK